MSTADKLREIDATAKKEREAALTALADQVLGLLTPLDPKDRKDIMFRVGRKYSSCCGEKLNGGGYCSNCNK